MEQIPYAGLNQCSTPVPSTYGIFSFQYKLEAPDGTYHETNLSTLEWMFENQRLTSQQLTPSLNTVGSQNQVLCQEMCQSQIIYANQIYPSRATPWYSGQSCYLKARRVAGLILGLAPLCAAHIFSMCLCLVLGSFPHSKTMHVR